MQGCANAHCLFSHFGNVPNTTRRDTSLICINRKIRMDVTSSTSETACHSTPSAKGVLVTINTHGQLLAVRLGGFRLEIDHFFVEIVRIGKIHRLGELLNWTERTVRRPVTGKRTSVRCRP
jgi:hypothetical protein